jgi:acyl-CoA synthetase (NDP forming)
VFALAKAWRYARWRSSPVGEFRRPLGIDRDRARELVGRLLPEGGATKRVPDAEGVELLGCYGIPVVPFRVVAGPTEAVRAAAELGYPVTCKGIGEQWQSSELIGVRLDLATEDAVLDAYRDLVRITGQDELIVQRMAPKGPSCRLEVMDDPSFGSLLAFGLSGIATELLGDRALRVVPLTTTDAYELIRAPRAAPLLTGYRGSAPVDLAALEELALRVSCLAEDVPELRSLRLGPVLAAAQTASVTAARIVLGQPPSRLDGGPRRLT